MKILHTNDLHGHLDETRARRLAVLREKTDFYFDSGDAVKAGNVGVPLGREPVWDLLRDLNCTAGVPGNREFHVLSRAFRSKLNGADQPILAANLHWNGRQRKPLQPHNGGLRVDQGSPLPSHVILGDVGIFGVMVPMVTKRMAARAVSAFVNSDPVEAAHSCVQVLKDCAVIICLSHAGTKIDRTIASRVDGVDLILGGHSHDLLDPPEHVGDTWICQAGSHAKCCGVYNYEGGRLEAEYVSLSD